MKPRKPLTRHPWPAHLGPNTVHDRARSIARGYRGWATKWAGTLPAAAVAELAALDRLAAAVGESAWLLPTVATHVEGQRLTREQVAQIAAVDTPAVVMWGRRGIRRGGTTTLLLTGADGLYDYRAVMDFLKLRDTAPTRESRSCKTPPRLNSPRSTTAHARAAAT
jgi:hypothetical protein